MVLTLHTPVAEQARVPAVRSPAPASRPGRRARAGTLGWYGKMAPVMRSEQKPDIEALRLAIESCGYFPALVFDSVMISLGGEAMVSYVVQHEPTITPDGIHRHVTVALLTPTRLIINHTDDADASPGVGAQAASTSEVVRLDRISSVSLSRIVSDPSHYRHDRVDLQEVLLTVAWGFASRIDLEPATCGDPHCEADHGMTGQLVGDDLVIRMSSDADGADGVAQLVDFGLALQRTHDDR